MAVAITDAGAGTADAGPDPGPGSPRAPPTFTSEPFNRGRTLRAFRETAAHEIGRIVDTATQTDLFIPSYQESNTYAPRETPDPGFYTLELVKIADPEPQKAEYNPDGTKMRARFDFKIVGASPENEDWIGAEVSDWYNLTMFETSALYPVVKALLGGTVDPAVRPSRSLLVGRRMQAMIVVEPKKTDPSVEVAKIKSPMALTTGKRAKKSAEPAAETTNDEVPF